MSREGFGVQPSPALSSPGPLWPAWGKPALLLPTGAGWVVGPGAGMPSVPWSHYHITVTDENTEMWRAAQPIYYRNGVKISVTRWQHFFKKHCLEGCFFRCLIFHVDLRWKLWIWNLLNKTRSYRDIDIGMFYTYSSIINVLAKHTCMPLGYGHSYVSLRCSSLSVYTHIPSMGFWKYKEDRVGSHSCVLWEVWAEELCVH